MFWDIPYVGCRCIDCSAIRVWRLLRVWVGGTVTAEPEYLECPCCGDVGAIADAAGCYVDGQLLVCGCVGWVSVDRETEPWINNGDGLCPSTAKCREPALP